MVQLSLEQRLQLAQTALFAAQRNAEDVTKNAVYWQGQAERERKLVQSLEEEIERVPAVD